MIKRDGVEIKTASKSRELSILYSKNKNVEIANETKRVLQCGEYYSRSGNRIDIKDQLAKAIAATIYYPEPLPRVDTTSIEDVIEVTREKTAEAAERLIRAGKRDVVALNFAAGNNPGGGYEGGARAQEEDLCRASGLYPCLTSKPMFYNANIESDDDHYTDGIIYSPDVPFFRDSENNFLEEPFNLSIITSPAPNLRERSALARPILEELIFNRMLKILQVAQLHGHKTLILGAWGCGAFCNDPIQIAELFAKALKTIPAFDHIVFPVFARAEHEENYKVFEKFFS